MADKSVDDALKSLSLARNDEAAWWQLYQSLRPAVFAQVYRLLGGSRDGARDATQEVFLRLVKYCQFDRFEEPSYFRAYVFVVARNVALRIKNHQEHPEVGSHSGEAWANSPADAVEAREVLEQALADLPAEDRKLLRLSLMGHSLHEIAEMKGVRPGSVAVRLHRIRRRVQAKVLSTR